MKNDYKKEYTELLKNVESIFSWWASNNQLELIIEFSETVQKIADKYKTKIPFVSFGNNELEKMPDLESEVICPHCGRKHKVQYAKKILEDGTEVEDKMLAFVKCIEDNKDYLVGVEGKDVSMRFRKNN